jgi:voltage-gated potassium channel
MNDPSSNKSPSEESRWQTLEDFRDWAEIPLIFLAFIWLALLVVELIWGLTPLITAFGTSIWIVFIIEFGISLSLAPKKLTYIRRNWLTVIALVVPALRILRFARVVRLLRVSRAIRGMRLIKVVGSLNRAMQALRSSMSRRGLGYMGVLSCIVILVGAAGMYAFEGGRQEAEGFQSQSSGRGHSRDEFSVSCSRFLRLGYSAISRPFWQAFSSAMMLKLSAERKQGP